LKQTLLIAALLFAAANGDASTKLNPNYSGRSIKTILAQRSGQNARLETRRRQGGCRAGHAKSHIS
jgi:hypothetical protein